MISFARIAEHHPRIAGIAPGARWWVPMRSGTRIRPWVGAHLGADVVQAASGDVTSNSTYWSVDAEGGVDFQITRALAVGTGISWAYADILNRPHDAPLPAGSAAAETSYALSWLTMRAGITLSL